MVYVGVVIVSRQPRRKGRVPCTPQISAYYASLVLCRTRAGAGSCTAAIDLRSLSLIGTMGRVGRDSGQRMVPYNLRFKLTEPHRRHAAWRHSRRARGGGGAGGEGGRGVRGKDMHALYFKF